MLNKRGMLVKETIEIILAAAAVFVLIVVLVTLLSPNFDRKEKTAESYRDFFLEQIDVADAGGRGEFSSFGIRGSEDKTEYILVYFGERVNVDNRFYSVGNNVNRFCVCYGDDGGDVCPACREIGYPALFEGSDSWFLKIEDKKININFVEDHYEIES